MVIIGTVLTVLLFYFMCLQRNWTSSEMVNRAQAARMLALMRYDKEVCESAEKNLPEDVSSSEWYGRYIAVVLNEGWMNVREDGGFHPGDTFTYSDLKYIMERFHLSEEHLSFSLKYRQKDGMVSRRQWCEVYQLLRVNSSRVTREKIKIHGSPENIPGLGPWQVVTDQGVKSGEGLSVGSFMDRQVEAYMAGDELLCVIGSASEECRMENVWIESGEGRELRIFFAGYERTIRLKEVLKQKLESNMGDLIFTKGNLTGIDYKTKRIKDSLIGMDGESVTLKNYGSVSLTENPAVYRIYPNLAVISPEELAADGTVYEFILEGDKICGIIYRDYAGETIRVLLHGASDDVYEQSSVTLTSEEALMIIASDEVSRHKAGTEVTLKPGDIGSGETRIKTESGSGKIKILSLDRSCGAPSYHGEICLQERNGNLIVINEVNLEDYVAGVIPGEMPVSYGEEALKVQAVCARTFARRALGNSFRDYPANLDDTVASQVYNNQEACAESIRAASETCGQVLQNGDGLTATYFFSTSCGHTSNPEDVWYSGSEDGQKEAVSVFLSDEAVSLELSKEEDFRRFIDRKDGYSYFEEDLTWFRWQVYLLAEEIQAGILNVYQTDIGTLESISVLERADSGLIKAIEVVGSDNRCTVYGEYKIRQVLSPANAELIPQNGETVTGWKLLPSAYCYMDPLIEENQCRGYIVRGGGYGHGSGMSQNGAMKMAEMGKNYSEILKYFFPDSELITE